MTLVGIRTFLGALFLLIFVLRKRELTKELLYSGIFLGPLLAIHWSTMFKSIELNTVAVGIGLVFSYPIFILIIELLRGKSIKPIQILIILVGFFGLYLLLDFTTISSIAGVVYGLTSALSLAILIIYGSSKSIEFGGLNVAFVQVFFAAIILSPFTYSGISWMFENFPHIYWNNNLFRTCNWSYYWINDFKRITKDFSILWIWNCFVSWYYTGFY